jgi:hypothetical protein
LLLCRAAAFRPEAAAVSSAAVKLATITNLPTRGSPELKPTFRWHRTVERERHCHEHTSGRGCPSHFDNDCEREAQLSRHASRTTRLACHADVACLRDGWSCLWRRQGQRVAGSNGYEWFRWNWRGRPIRNPRRMGLGWWSGMDVGVEVERQGRIFSL